ncbi:MAG TPA: PIN domain-containing protein [Candidatus Acetothermia bacterium]|nr:PIN domain-containing protein [Candidatus Acetothermia bacterium]
MSPERVFLDANILFSAAYGSRGLLQLWQWAREGKCLLLTSSYAVEEARRNLSDPSQLESLERLLQDIQIVPDADPSIPCPVDLPEKDRPLLLAAIAAKADYFLTGDITNFGRFFGEKVGGVKICRPRDYFSSPDL